MRRRDHLGIGLILVAALSVYPILEWGSFPYPDGYPSDEPARDRLDAGSHSPPSTGSLPMRITRKHMLGLTLAVIGSLGLGAVWQWTSPPYPDLRAYVSDARSDRLDFIEEVLGEAGLPITKKWVPEFVDQMIRGASTYATGPGPVCCRRRAMPRCCGRPAIRPAASSSHRPCCNQQVM